MKVKIDRKRPGKKLQRITGLSLYDENGNYLGMVGISKYSKEIWVQTNGDKFKIDKIN